MGRPKGAENITRDNAVVKPSRCPDCGSTKRCKYLGSPVVQEYGGVHEGQEFTHIVRRKTICSDCGRHRFDRSYEYHPPAKAKRK